jgi:hypothetical protein
MRIRKLIRLLLALVLLSVNIAYASRDYDPNCILTVNWDCNDPEYDPNKDYDTINLAIENMPALSSTKLGCIKVYDGTYWEALNSWYDDPDQGFDVNDYQGRDLPAHCDLIGTGRNKVFIKHTRQEEYKTGPRPTTTKTTASMQRSCMLLGTM